MDATLQDSCMSFFGFGIPPGSLQFLSPIARLFLPATTKDTQTMVHRGKMTFRRLGPSIAVALVALMLLLRRRQHIWRRIASVCQT
jgi:hypothetical protein